MNLPAVLGEFQIETPIYSVVPMFLAALKPFANNVYS